jgi:hypothetical protein
MIHINKMPIIPGPITLDVNSDDEEFYCGLPATAAHSEQGQLIHDWSTLYESLMILLS